jgi:hypothetical protein
MTNARSAYGIFYASIARVSTRLLLSAGNGKRHSTPSPVGLRKIKRVSLKVFLGLKESVNSVKEITPRGNRKKSKPRFKEHVTVIPNYIYEYEPSNIIYADDSLLWQWRRVNEWHRYINDPVDKIKGHMIT